jgi:hypothetical protein
MEVHAHSHTARKKWTHYFWEFLMLFLAVTLGFFVENQREHFIENKRERQYIQSFYEDLTADERDLQSNTNFLRAQARQADSLHALMKNITTKQPANLVYMYLRGVIRGTAGLLYPNDKTIVQLRNAGGMRLIKNKGVSDSMALYYREVELIRVLSQEGQVNKASLREKSTPLLNADDYAKVVDSNSAIINPSETIYLRQADPEVINSCLIEVNRIKTLNGGIAIRIQRLKERAARIKDFIKKEYHLK